MPGLKKVLWVTSYFPPRINVATNRNVKFIKYLPQFGWEVVVISPREILGHSSTSQGLMKQINDSTKQPSMPMDPFHFLYDRAGISRTARYTGYLLNNAFPPDGHFLWSLWVLFHLSKEIKKYKPDMIYTTCSPFSLNLVGAWIKYKYDIPWVTDFRDLWTLNPTPKRILNSYHRFVSNRLEKSYLRYCDALLVTTVNTRSRIKEKYPFLINKTWNIPNGFDPEDIHIKGHDKIQNSFFYGGLIDPKRNYTPLPILRLLARFQDSELARMPVKLHYAGNEGNEFKDLCHQTGTEFNIKTHGYLDHKSFYDLIMSMENIIMCMPQDVDTRSWIPARFYDYIGTKSRIICLAPRVSEIALYIKEYGNGITLYYEESEEISKQKLQRFLSMNKPNNTMSNQFIERFSRKNLTRQLSNVFQYIISD
jgi:glycosyltransferase involved in cell wall biosynthesis